MATWRTARSQISTESWPEIALQTLNPLVFAQPESWLGGFEGDRVLGFYILFLPDGLHEPYLRDGSGCNFHPKTRIKRKRTKI